MPGYLYCFPNDVWSLYDNNHGSLRLTVTRVDGVNPAPRGP
jgi:hypothetical protein